MTTTDRAAEPVDAADNTDDWDLPLDAPATPVVWGVCASMAQLLGVSVTVLRAAIVVLSVAGGFGVIVYLGLAVWSRRTTIVAQESSATRDLGVALATAGLAWELSRWWPGARAVLVVPVALVAMGVVLGWRAPESVTTTNPSKERSLPRTLFGPVVLRIAGGSVLCLAGMGFVLGRTVPMAELRDTAIAIAVAMAGVAIVMGPTAVRIGRSFGAERDARIRGHERAAVAAHLHDSVLQTLTLIQKRSDDPAAMVALARHQERSLRRWLYGGGEAISSLDGAGWRGRAEQLVAEVEDQYLIAVELVMVGDGPSTERIDAALFAAREALVNAAKFSGVDTVSMFCERTAEAFDVYVHDRGKGFVMDEIASDRHGVRGSIIARLQRIGGRATVRTQPGDGTEIHLEVAP